MLTLDGVVAGYGGGDVLHGVDLTCDAGSITCIVGPNGAGKSTVLRVVSGLLRPRQGTVTFGGRSVGGLGPDAILGLGVTQVPQAQALFPAMTVRENVLMGGFLIRRDRALLRRRYEAVENLVPLVAERPSVPAGNLSGGQRRMVEIGRCLMLDPTLILLDEPSLGLDPRSLGAVAALIRRLNEAGTTMVLVEQNVRLGLGIATHGVVMEGGRVRLRGPADEIGQDPQIAALYLGGTPSAADEEPDRTSSGSDSTSGTGSDSGSDGGPGNGAPLPTGTPTPD